MVAEIKSIHKQIDRYQIQQHVEALGFSLPTDTIYLRAFFPSNDPRRDTDKGRKAEAKSIKEICRIATQWQREGRGVHIGVNGGGHTSDAIVQGRAVFYEHDNLSKEIQAELWQHIGLPEPTFQVDTGGKSIHSYWVLVAPIGIDSWRELQKALLEFADGDRNIKNSSRVMRLAGCYHSSGEMSRIISNSGKRYSYEELRAIIPHPEPEPEPEQTNYTYHAPSPHTRWTDSDYARSYVDALCPSRADSYEDWIAVGMALHSVGDDSLLDDWDNWSRQSSKYRPKDCVNKWRSFKRTNGVSLGTLAFYAKQDGWQSPHKSQSSSSYSSRPTGKAIGSSKVVQHPAQQNKGSGNGGDGGGSNGNGGDDPSTEEYVKKEVDAGIKQRLSGSEKRIRINQISIVAKWHPSQVEKVWREREAEIDQQEEQPEILQNLSRYLKNEALNPHHYLWGDNGKLATAIAETAAAMPTTPGFLFTTLLSAASTCIGTSSRVVIKASAKYKQPCVFQTAIVARSGKLKSPAQNVVLEPLYQLEVEEGKKYLKALERYEIELSRWKKDKDADPEDKPVAPVRKRYLTKDATIEALERIHGQNPRGILVHRDELVEDFKSENAYRGGKGADREKKLDQWNGSAIITDRKEREIVLERSAISRTGGIQWDVLSDLMGDGYDSNGSLARWLFCCDEAPNRFINFDNEADTGITEQLLELYKKLEQLPECDYLLDEAAKLGFKHWQHELVELEIETTHPALQLAYPKLEAYTARFALWLHLVNAVLADRKPAPTINVLTMNAAINLAQYFKHQLEVVLAVNSPQSGITGRLLKIQQYALGKPKGVKPGKLKGNIRDLRELDVTQVWADCQWLVDNGYGVLEKGTYFATKAVDKVDAVDKRLTELSTAGNPTDKGIQPLVDKVDTFSSFKSIPQSQVPTPPTIVGSSPPLEPVNSVNQRAESLAPPAVDTVDTVVNQSVNQCLVVNQSVNQSPKVVDAVDEVVNQPDAISDHPTPSPAPDQVVERFPVGCKVRVIATGSIATTLCDTIDGGVFFREEDGTLDTAMPHELERLHDAQPTHTGDTSLLPGLIEPQFWLKAGERAVLIESGLEVQVLEVYERSNIQMAVVRADGNEFRTPLTGLRKI